MLVFDKKHPVFLKLNWVAKARFQNKDFPDRPWMRGIFFDGEGNVAATDGKRLHIWKNGPCFNGYYQATVTSQAITLTRDLENKFPDWKKVIPTYEKSILSISFSSRKDPHFSLEIFRLFAQTKACFNINFIEALGDELWYVYGNDPDSAFLFKNSQLEAVIMPMNLSN